jgi:hypothetical protein
MSSAIREARLRQEFFKLYPGLSPGTWLPAREVAEHIVDVVRREGGRLGLHGRLMADEHFEFRGGDSDRPRSRDERREDRSGS